MMQELLGGGTIIGGERSKLSAPSCGGGGGILDHSSPSPSVSPSPAATAAENLRCPRCDSSNTKFCYYNNYNLTQPRHFCKTCRRYWTKGGALRNVPIGGGCRKNKTATITAAVGKSSSGSAAAKFKSPSVEIGKTSLFAGIEHADTLSSNPIIRASSQNSHFLSLIRGNQTQTTNPNHLTNSMCMKEEVGVGGGGGGSLFGSSHLSSDAAISNGGRAFGLDHLGPAHLPSMGVSNSVYRNQTLASQGLILHGEVQSNGLQELYQRLRSSVNFYSDHAPANIHGNMASANSSTTANSAILESAPVAAGEMGFWNSTVSWPENLPTTHGVYP